MLDWSYDLLPEAERVVLRRLSVFVGPFSLEAAQFRRRRWIVEREQVAEAIAALSHEISCCRGDRQDGDALSTARYHARLRPG